MKKLSLMLLVLFTLLFSLNVNAASYDILFDDYPDDMILSDIGVADYIGSGIFDFDTTTPGAVTNTLGHYRLDTIDFTFSITFPGYSATFTNANIVNSSFYPTNYFNSVDDYDTWVVISSDEQFVTLEGSQSPSSGALDFWDNVNNYYLSFADGTPIYSFIDVDTETMVELGNYGMTSAVPVPAALWLFGSGLAGLALLRRKRS